jgi:hypothetical protein
MPEWISVGEVHGDTGVGVDGWRHLFSRLKSAGTHGFGIARTTTGVDG